MRELPDHERLPWKRHVVRRGETLTLLASRYGTTADTLREVNQLPGNRVRPGNVVRVPLSARATGTSVLVADASETVAQPAERTGGDVQGKERKAAPALKVREPAAVTQKLVVRPGETLYSLARRYGVTPQALASLNGLSAQTRVQAGQTLTVQAAGEPTTVASSASTPAKGAAADRPDKPVTTPVAAPAKGAPPEKVAATVTPAKAGTATNAPAEKRGAAARTARAADPIRYKVKPGETLWAVSQRFGVTVAMLRRWNNLSEKQGVQAGQELNVYREDSRIARAG
jgi:membrane-bound lytic murein transglycosylase D